MRSAIGVTSCLFETSCTLLASEGIGPMHHAAASVGKIERERTEHATWFSWMIGGTLLVFVIVAALHFSEERAFLRVAEEAKPWWLGLAVLLQAGTYLAQGGVWRLAARTSEHSLSRRDAVELSLAKLFADQALPSAGLSSSILIAKALEHRHLSPAAVRASVLLNIASYHVAYVITLVGALAHRCSPSWSSAQDGRSIKAVREGCC